MGKNCYRRTHLKPILYIAISSLQEQIGQDAWAGDARNQEQSGKGKTACNSTSIACISIKLVSCSQNLNEHDLRKAKWCKHENKNGETHLANPCAKFQQPNRGSLIMGQACLSQETILVKCRANGEERRGDLGGTESKWVGHTGKVGGRRSKALYL